MQKTKAKVIRLPTARRFLLPCTYMDPSGKDIHGTIFVELSPQQWSKLLYEYEVAKPIIENRQVMSDNWCGASIHWSPLPFPPEYQWIEIGPRDEDPLTEDPLPIEWSITIDCDGVSFTGSMNESAFQSGCLDIDHINP